jgi:hypothetical protein
MKEAIFELRAKGYSYNQIKAELNCSKGTISYHLGPGQKQKTIGRMMLNRASISNFIKHFKETNACSDCGNFYAYYVMQFDHRPEHTKSFGLSHWYNYTQDFKVVKAEMDKCDLVCGNCHTTRGHYRRLEANGLLMDEEF